MNFLKTYEKQPWEVKDYTVDYTDWLNEPATPDALSTVVTVVTCISTPGAVTLAVDSVTVSSTAAIVVVSGGTAGETYRVTLRATTTGEDGIVRKDEVDLRFVVKDV